MTNFRYYRIRYPEWYQDNLPEGVVTQAWMNEVSNQLIVIEQELGMLRSERARMLIVEGIARECYEILKHHFDGKDLTQR